VAVTRIVFEKCLRTLSLVVLMPVAMATFTGCANTQGTNIYVIGDEAPAPSGYSAAVLAKRIVPLGFDGV
jgi:hypothetical protein